MAKLFDSARMSADGFIAGPGGAEVEPLATPTWFRVAGGGD
jgi:hypothetical protein